MTKSIKYAAKPLKWIYFLGGSSLWLTHQKLKELSLISLLIWTDMPIFSPKGPELIFHATPNFLLEKCFPSSYSFRGYDILETDGSDFDIPFDPSDPATFIKNCYNTGSFSQYHVSFLFNTFDRRFVDCVIHPRNFYNENTALYEMMKRYLLWKQCI